VHNDTASEHLVTRQDEKTVCSSDFPGGRANGTTENHALSWNGENEGNEGFGIGFQALRTLPHHSAQGHRAGDLHQPAPQAAAGIAHRRSG
jgi:hypothetical protein